MTWQLGIHNPQRRLGEPDGFPTVGVLVGDSLHHSEGTSSVCESGLKVHFSQDPKTDKKAVCILHSTVKAKLQKFMVSV